MTDSVVTRNEAASRYEVHVDGALAGISDFVQGEGSVVFTHTETFPQFSGQGLGLALTKAAVADAVARGEAITPVCPFVRRYLERNDVPGAVVLWPPSE